MMKQIEMMTESISPYKEIILFGHGYKRTELERARDQFNDVTVLIKYFKHSPVLLILYHSGGSYGTGIYARYPEDKSKKL